jgi:NADPH:quinone reductase-like Zn-dependent oxidoreductase
VNPSDLIPVTGAYAQRISLPSVAGYEGVGRVIECHPHLSHLIGTRVLPIQGEGTWQSIVECPLENAIVVPENIDDRDAARAYINPISAIAMLERWPVRGKCVLLTGAGSNLVDVLTRVASSQNARKLIGVYRSDNRLQRLRSLGVEAVPLDDVSALARASYEADVVFDALGGDVGTRILNAMREKADFVAYGLLSGQPITHSQRARATYHRFHLRDELALSSRKTLHERFSAVWQLIAEEPFPEADIFPAYRWRDAIQATYNVGRNKPLLNMSKLPAA